MASLYSLSIRWVKTPINSQLIDNALMRAGADWLRLDSWQWFVYSNMSAAQISEIIRGVLHREDSLVVMRCDLSDYSGWLPEWVWNWFSNKRAQQYGSAGLGSLGGSFIGSSFMEPKE